MIKSYSNQKNRRPRPENLVIRVKAVLPDNISSNVKNQLTEVLASTKFSKLPINIFVPTRLIYTEDSNDDRKPFRRNNNFISAGFIRNYFIEDKSFEVVVFNKYAANVSMFKTPAIEIIFMESNDELVNIVRFNIIDVDEVLTDNERRERRFSRNNRRNTSYRSPVQNAVPLNPKAVNTKSEQPLETPKETKKPVDESNTMGVTIGDMFKDSIPVDDVENVPVEENPKPFVIGVDVSHHIDEDTISNEPDEVCEEDSNDNESSMTEE